MCTCGVPALPGETRTLPAAGVPLTLAPTPPPSRPLPAAEAPKPNAVFDESGNFLLYATILGIKVRTLGALGRSFGCPTRAARSGRPVAANRSPGCCRPRRVAALPGLQRWTAAVVPATLRRLHDPFIHPRRLSTWSATG